MKSTSTDGSLYTRKACPVNKSQANFELNFRGEKISTSTKPTLLSLIDDKASHILGPVDEEWFIHCKARLHKDKEKKDDVQGTFTKDDTVTLPRLKSALSPQKQEQRTESSFITPLHPGKGRHLFAPSPLLFSPEDNEVLFSNRKKQHSTVKQDEWTTPRGYLRTHRNFGLSPATPACSAITPNQVTAISQMSAVGSISQPSPNFSPFPTWNPNLQDDTPMFMKRLFKTPKTLTRSGSVRSHTMPASTMKTPQRLSVSLGADMDISNISWSSSLATPPATSSEKKKLDFSTDEKSEISFEDGECKKGQITARALFTTDQPDSRCDPDNISRVEVAYAAPVRGVFNMEGYMQSEESPPLARMPDTESSDIAYEVILDADRMHEAKKVSKELGTEPNKQRGVLDKTTEHCQKKIASDGQNINIEMSSDPDNLNNNNNMMCDKSVIHNARSETLSKNPQFDSDMTIRFPQSEKSKPSSSTLNLPECIANKTPSIEASQGNMAASKSPQHVEEVDFFLGQQKSSQIDVKQGSPDVTSPQRSDSVKLAAKATAVPDSSPCNNSNIAETLAFLFDTPPTTDNIRNLRNKSEEGSLVNDKVSSCRESCLTTVDSEKNNECIATAAKIDSKDARDKNSCTSVTTNTAKFGETTTAKCTSETHNAGETQKLLLQGNCRDSKNTPSKRSNEVSVSAIAQESTCSDLHNTTIENLDMFSQMSPTFAEALVLATDMASAKHAADTQASTTLHRQGVGQASVNKKVTSPAEAKYIEKNIHETFMDKAQGNIDDSSIKCGSSETSCDIQDNICQEGAAVTAVSVTPETLNSHADPTTNTAISEMEKECVQQGQDDIASGTIEGACSRHDTALPESASEVKSVLCQQDSTNTAKQEPECHKKESNTSIVCTQQSDSDSLTAVFKSKSKSARRFYYPSSRSCASRSHLQQKSLLSKMTPLENCSDAAENGKTEAESGENNTSSDLEQSSITSSTPTVPKRSAGAFMSFTAYMKSVESQQTPRDSVAQKVQSSATPVSGSAGKYETPRTSRETGTNPGLGCRRRVGNFYQPAAKKLKTVAVLNTVPNGVNKNQGCESLGDVSSNMTPGNNSSSERTISCVDMKPAGVESFIQRKEQKNIGSLDGLSLKNTHGQLSPHAAQTAVISTQTLHSAQSAISQSAIQSDHKSENEPTQMGNVMGLNENSCGNTRSNTIAKSQNSHEGVCDTSIPYEQTGMHSQEKVFTADKDANLTYTIPEKNTAFHDLFQNQDQCEFAGFCTASGAKITVSESAMSKARKLVEEVELETSMSSSKTSNRGNLVQGQASAGDSRTDSKESECMIKSAQPLPHNNIKLDSGFGGFTAASGKKITVSDTAMKRAQSILQQVDDCLVSGRNAALEGFKSASGKSISVSDTAMKKAKSILEDVNCDVIQNESNSTKGFTTVVGKDNAVPSAPKGKTKLGREGDSGFVPAKDSKDFVGFTSASGKSIAVSETAMRKAKSILEQVDSSITEIDNAKDENEELHVQSFTGFVSASGKDINISAAAMLKAKQLVSEIEKNEESQVKADAGAGNSALSRTTGPVPRPQRDFQRMPKRFRPFKPPSRVRVPTRDVTEALETPQIVNSEVTSCTHTETQSHGLNAKDDAEDHKEKCHAGSVEERENTQMDLKNADCEEKSEDLNDTFNDDYFSATQVRRELEAVEQLEMQMAGITEDDLINMNDDDMTLDDEKSPDEMKSEVGEIGCQSQAPDAQSEGHTMAVQNSECGDDRSQTKTAVEEEPAQQTAVPDTGDHQLMIVDDASRCNTDDKQLLTVAKQVKSKIEDFKPATDPEGILDKAICAEHDFSTDDEVFLNFGKCEMWENDNKHCEVGKHQVTELDKANRNGEESRDDLDSETVKADVQSAEKEGKQAGFITFQGFQTASGNTVQVSEESLALAKKMFEDDENSHHGNSDAVEDTHLLDGACTAVGMVTSHTVDVNVHDGQSNTEDREGSDRGVSIAESAEATQPDTDGVPTVLNARIASEMHDPSDGRLSKTVDFVGFKTASWQSVSVSEESLFKARKLLTENGDDVKDGPETSIAITRDSNCVSAKPRELTTKENSCPSPPKPFLGFQTAGGSKVTVSEDSLKKAKLLLAEETANTEYTVFQKNINTLPEFTGFQTAGGRKVTVSEESLKIAKGLFSEVEMSECSKNNESKTDRDNSVKKKFTAQSDNSLVPSKVNEGGRIVMNDRATASTSTNPQANAGMSSSLHTEEPFLGFRTGSGSAIQISEASLKRARDFLASDDDNFNTESEKGHTGGGFQTASGTKISVSQEALAQAKNFLKDVDANGGSNELCAKTNTNEPLIGFKTARGAQVSISEKSLEKARRLLAEDMADKEPCVYGREESMFTTAGGNAVTVSSSALDKAKEFINKEDVETTPNPPEGFCGFQTGLGKPVKVSAESMAKARRLLADTEQSDSTETSGDKKTKSQIATTGSLSTEHTVRTWPSTSDKLSSEVSCEKSKSSGVEMKRLPIKRTYPSAGIEEPPRKKANIGDFNQAKQKKALLTSPTGFANDRTQKFTRAMQPLVSSPLITSCDNASVTDIHPTVSATTQNAHGSNYTTRKPSTVSRNQRLISGKASSFKTPFRNSAAHASRVVDATEKGVSENKQGVWPLKKKSRSDLNSGEKDGNGGGQEDAEVRLSRRKSMPASVDSSRKDQHHDMTRRLSLRQPPRCSSWTAKAMQAKKGDCKVTAVRPVMGALYSKRLRQPRIALHQLVKGQAPSSYTEEELHSFGVPPNTVSVKCSNAESYRFHGRDHYSESVCCSEDGVTLTDGGVLHLDGSGTMGKEQFLSALYSTPGVDSELISEEWVSNHYKWIVWKLAAMEVSYPNIFAARFLTPDMVMLQLKYRYDREIDHSHRSAIKKILERDDTPSRRLVLCVSAISVNTESDKPPSDDQNDDRKQSNKDRSMAMTLELTDGWYGIKTIIDRPLTKLASCGKIQIGTKLFIYGAELIGSQDACSPLEAPSNIALKICSNSTRRARYDARLGYQSTPHPYPVLLNTLYADGGLVGCVDVVVVRSYPMQYVEKLSDGSNIVRSSKAEQKAAEIFEREKQKRLDWLYSKLRDEFEKREANATGKRKRCRPCGQKLSIKEIEKLESGQEIFEAIQGATDPSSIEAYLNERQFVRLQSYRQSLNEKKQFELQAELQKALADQSEEFPSSRNVTGIFKVRVTGYTDCEHNTSCILTVWRPSEDVMNLLCEGARLRIFNLSTSASRSRHGGSEVQLSSMRTTRYKQLAVTTELMDYVYQPRVVTDFSEMSSHYFERVYNEVDVVGLVVFVSGLSGSGLQSVYIADANQNIIAIKFWGGVQNYHVEEMLKVRNFIVAANLQWRADDRSRLPCVFTGDLSAFTQKPRESHLKAALAEIQNQIKDPKSFIEDMQDVMDSTIFGKGTSNVTPLPGRHSSRLGFKTPGTTPAVSHRSRIAGNSTTPTWHATLSSTSASDTRHLRNQPAMKTPISAACADSSGTPQASVTHSRRHAANTATMNTPITAMSSRTFNRVATGMDQGSKSTSKPNDKSMPGPNTNQNSVAPLLAGQSSIQSKANNAVTPIQPGKKSRLLTLRSQDFTSHSMKATPDYLSQFPSPPPLSPLPSPLPQAVRKSFRPPVRFTTPLNRGQTGSKDKMIKENKNYEDSKNVTKSDVKDGSIGITDAKNKKGSHSDFENNINEDNISVPNTDIAEIKITDDTKNNTKADDKNAKEVNTLAAGKCNEMCTVSGKVGDDEVDGNSDRDGKLSERLPGDGSNSRNMDPKDGACNTELKHQEDCRAVAEQNATENAVVTVCDDIEGRQPLSNAETTDVHREQIPGREQESASPGHTAQQGTLDTNHDKSCVENSTECDTEANNTEEQDALLALHLSQLDESLFLDAIPTRRVTRSQSRRK